MLQILLRLMRDPNVRSQSDLAEQLGVTEALVADMVNQLVQQGYLEESAQCGGDACGGCSLKAACGTKKTLRFWSLTDKGKAAINK